MLETVWVADRDRDLADADGARIAERRERKRRAIGADANDRQIGMHVATDEVGLPRSAVWKHHVEPAAARDDVVFRKDEAVGREDDARPASALDVDLDDRGADDLDGVRHRPRVGVEQFIIIGLRDHGSIVGTRSRREITQTGGAWLKASRCRWREPLAGSA